MNRKENALEIIKFGNPEFVDSSIPGFWLSYRGANHEGYNGGGHNCPVGTVWTDIWGTGWHKRDARVMGFPEDHPLADPDDLDVYSWPDSEDERIYGPIYDSASRITDEIRKEKFIIGNHRDVLWEKSYMLVGMENMMIYMLTEPDYAKRIFHNIMDFQLGIARHYVKCGVEMVYMSDDLGTQHSLILSKEMIAEFLLPEYRRLFEFYKEHGVMIHFHSCGHIIPLLETFIDLGVTILNPVQATANDLEKVVKITGNRMCLDGAISTALLEQGTEAGIDEEVKRVIGLLGKNGGYFCAPDQEMPIPKSHLDAMYEAVGKYGKYPVS